MMRFQNYKHVTPVQIRFVDIDRLNHVNNSCYLSFFELGRVNYFNKVLENIINWSENGFVLARTEIDHLNPIFLNDEVYCFTRVERIGNKSLTIKNSVVKILGGQFTECASGLGVLVAMDYLSNQSIVVPEAWRAKINDFESD